MPRTRWSGRAFCARCCGSWVRGLSDSTGPRSIFHRRRRKTAALLGVALEDPFGEEVFHLGLVAQHLVVSALQQLLAAVAQLLADVLLHLRVAEIALAGRLARQQLEDGVGNRFPGGWVQIGRASGRERV